MEYNFISISFYDLMNDWGLHTLAYQFVRTEDDDEIIAYNDDDSILFKISSVQLKPRSM